jgi:sugar phosphate isomerase/epimerase
MWIAHAGIGWVVLTSCLLGLVQPCRALDRIVVGPDQRTFVEHSTGRPFVPWGFNYDHDRDGRLLEDFWDDEWSAVEADFREMRDLGANVVRIHLQFGRIMDTADTPRAAALDQLKRLVELAEATGLYLDLTGLGCYHKQDVPAWYDALSESERWGAQADFWRAVAGCCAKSDAVFCYDLMNEPVVPAGQPTQEWLGPAFGDKHFVQRIGLDLAGRERSAVARDWIRQLTAAIREADPHHLITVGLVPWSLERPGLRSGFDPQVIGAEVDFVAVHLYPEAGQLPAAMETLRGFSVGKPVVIEETFLLKCGEPEFREFLAQSKSVATGWIGFYWGVTPEEYAREETIPAAMTRQWLQVFQELGAEMQAVPAK